MDMYVVWLLLLHVHIIMTMVQTLQTRVIGW